jgi:hypothetical protein
MKRISTPSVTGRAIIGALFFVTGIFLIVFGFFTARLHSAQPASGTLNSSAARRSIGSAQLSAVVRPTRAHVSKA